ncbi:MAG: TetR/AcrR family transcriptional regulator [Mobilitalea sp.]
MDKNILHRKDRLIITTIDIINELGIHSLSTREIARREGVSEATLFRHYKSKNDLLIAVLDSFSQFDHDIFQSIEIKQLGPVESLKYLVNAYSEYYENYPAITAILELYEVFRYDVDLAEKINDIQHNRTDMMKQLIQEAIDLSELPPFIDSYDLAVLISGMSREICLNWRLSHFDFKLSERIQATLTMLLTAFNKEKL